MLRGDASGRVPFALVAVLLLLSAGFAAVLSAKLAREEAAERAREARLASLVRLSDLIHGEVESQAQLLAVRAVGLGTSGAVNESRIQQAFREGFSDYLRSHFPRVVRGVRVDVPAYEAGVYLVDRKLEDAVISNASRLAVLNGTSISAVDPAAPDGWETVDALAYHAVLGSVNYTLVMDGTSLARTAPLRIYAPVPVPLMATRLERAAHAGLGDFGGVGQTVKAILATLVQFRVLSGWASPARPGTTTRDILTVRDVELAVNLALLLEQVRAFRTFDPEAAAASDSVRGALREIPAGLRPDASGRGLAHLLETYAANGTVEAADLFAIYTGLDAEGIDMAAVLGQSIAAIVDELSLKYLDYLGLTPLLDFFKDVSYQAGELVDGFLRWLSGRPSKQVEFVHGYLKVALVDTGVGTQFLGPVSWWVPERTYTAGGVNLTVPEHAAPVLLPARDLLSSEYHAFWEDYFPRFNVSVSLVGRSLRTLVNEVATQIAKNAVLSRLLPASATGSVDPKDDASLIRVLGDRVNRAVDEAIHRVATDPKLLESLAGSLWESVRAAMRDLVEHVIARYDSNPGNPDLVLVKPESVLPPARDALVADQFTRAMQDPDYGSLDDGGRRALHDAVAADVSASGWVEGAYAHRKGQDAARWRNGVDVVSGESLRGSLLAMVAGSAGWLLLARDMVRGIFREAEAAHEVAGLRAVLRTQLGPFTLSEPSGASRTEAFRVRQFPPFLRSTGPSPGDPEPGELTVAITDPASVPLGPETPNVHYTKPFARSERPFTTTWSVSVAGAVRLRVETASGVRLVPGDLVPIALDRVIPLRFSFSIPAYSGWSLAGVAYRNSDFWLDDLKDFLLDFLKQAWAFLEPLIRPFLDALKQAARILLQLVEPLLRLGRQAVEFLARLFPRVLDLLRMVVNGTLDAIGLVLDFFHALDARERSFVVHSHGLTFDVRVNAPEGRRVFFAARAGALSAHFEIVDLEAAGKSAPGGPRWDFLVDGAVEVGPFRMAATLDPAIAFATHMVEGFAAWEGAWALDLRGPFEEARSYAGLKWGLPGVPTPLGVADVEFGVRVSGPGDSPRRLLSILEGSYDDAIADLGGPPRTFEGIGHFFRAYAQRIRERLVEFSDDTVSLEAYVLLELKEADAAGGGFALSLVVEGRAIREFLAWLVRNALAFLRAGLNPLAPAEYEPLPPVLAERVWVRATGFLVLETPDLLRDYAQLMDAEVRVAGTVSANVAAIGALFGHSWGTWAVEFGAYLSVRAGRVSAGFFEVGSIVNIWILRGTVHGA